MYDPPLPPSILLVFGVVAVCCMEGSLLLFALGWRVRILRRAIQNFFCAVRGLVACAIGFVEFSRLCAREYACMISDIILVGR